MSDEKIISFEDIKNRVNDDDLNLFEDFMTEELLKLNFDGDMDMLDFAKKISKYQEDNDIPPKKFMEIQTKLMERYGFDIKDAYPGMLKDIKENSGKIRANDLSYFFKDVDPMDFAAVSLSLSEEYKDKVEEKKIISLCIKNDKNDLRIIFDNTIVSLISEKKIDFSDGEVNHAISHYKEVLGNSLRIQVCEASNAYDYM